MAYLWHSSKDDNWVPTELKCSMVLVDDTATMLAPMEADGHPGEVLLYSHRLNSVASSWVLLAPPDSLVYVNHFSLASGIRILADRDAIRISARQPIYFSTARLAGIEAFPYSEQAFCPRCKLEIAEHDACVCCPQCQVWHHQSEHADLACWSYAETCALCDQSTDLDSVEFRWTPGEL